MDSHVSTLLLVGYGDMTKKKKRQEPIVSIICYWRWLDDHPDGKKWELADSYGADEDGRPLTPTTVDTGYAEPAYLGWMFATHEDRDWETIRGRAVTFWSFASGVSLRSFHPPQPTPWMNPLGLRHICDHREWTSIIYGGFELWAGTMEEARKILLPEMPPPAKS